jgi:HD superfamily phosphohydrolase
MLSTEFTGANSQVAESGGSLVKPWGRIIKGMLGCFNDSRKRLPQSQKKAAMEHLLPQAANQASDSGIYDYAEPYKIVSTEPETQLIRRLSNTRAFRRLSDVRFLGALDYCLVSSPNGSQSNARFTRAQHSIGVAAIARTYLKLTSHTASDRFLCIAAAMLHDIGHPPFSHTLEPIFQERFGIDHHHASEKIILGTAYSTDISETLSEFGVSPDAVVDVLNGDDERFGRFFSGPINFDTIEGILRSRNYLKMQNLGITPVKVVEAATKRDNDRSRELVDAFWSCKDEMYTLVIRSKLGVLFDSLFQEAAKEVSDTIVLDDFFLTETQAFRKFPILREATQRKYWHRMGQALLPAHVPFQVRRFYVDQEGDFFQRQDHQRYKQSKTASSLTLKDVLPA